MAQPQSEEWFRQVNQDISGSLELGTGTSATQTLKAARNANSTIFVQRIVVTILTDAAQTLTFQDTAGSPVKVEATDASPGANTRYEWQFTARGKPLTEAKDFVMAISGAGLGASIQWAGYSKITTAMAAGSTN